MHTLGVMVEFSTDNGKKISYMVKVNLPGLMAEATKAHTLTTLKVDLEFTPGQMVKNSKANGRTEIKMVKEFSQILKVSLEGATGKTEKE